MGELKDNVGSVGNHGTVKTKIARPENPHAKHATKSDIGVEFVGAGRQRVRLQSKRSNNSHTFLGL